MIDAYLIALAILTPGFVIAFLLLLVAIREERRRRQRLEHWLRGNLLVIRATCATSSEEVVTIVNSLECALPVLARVDAEGLERRLHQLRHDREARLLRSVSEIAARKGRP